MTTGLARINHIVVLMLENRSFDSILGKLYPKSAGFEGLAGNEMNLDAAGKPVSVWNAPGTDRPHVTIPDPDPGELWLDINTQIFGKPDPGSTDQANMSGFAKNYAHQTEPPDGTCDPASVMHYYTPEQLPVLSRLARQFAVCDQWHASAPCQTWPNRFFVHTGTANGFENNSPAHFPYKMPTIFTRFNQVGKGDDWRIYFHDMPQSLTLSDLWCHLDNFRLYPEFQHDAAHGTLPAYSFIEPRYFADAELQNDQHPPHIVTLGEQLIADVYNCLRNGPNWTETLLIITYDEHGGCYDHVPPPAAVPPSSIASQPFNFDRYGVRVPAVLVSPYIRQGTVLRAPPGSRPFDHTSIIASVRQRFSLGAPLSQREAEAPDVGGVLSLPSPDNIGPAQLAALPYVATPGELARARAEPLNDLQKSLLDIAARLPGLSACGGVASEIQVHIDSLPAECEQVIVPVETTVAEAVSTIKNGLTKLFKDIA